MDEHQMNHEEILDQLNKLTAQVKDLIAEKEEQGDVFYGDEGCVEKAIRLETNTFESDSYLLEAVSGYSPGVEVLCRITDTGNGFIANFPSYSNCSQENYICMDYAEAEYLRKLLSFIHKENT
jgi:hypothetical protein